MPKRLELLQSRRVLDLQHFAELLHRAIPGQLALRLSPCLFRTMPSRQRIARLDVASDLRCDTETDAAAPHFRKRDGSLGSVLLVRQSFLALTNLGSGPREIAVPFQRVHRQIEVS